MNSLFQILQVFRVSRIGLLVEVNDLIKLTLFKSKRMKLDPINPSPPVTKIFFMLCSLSHFLHGFTHSLFHGSHTNSGLFCFCGIQNTIGTRCFCRFFINCSSSSKNLNCLSVTPSSLIHSVTCLVVTDPGFVIL